MSRHSVETRLTPFEHYMLADDRQTLPMRFCVRMRLSGQLELDRFRDAFNTTVSEQPLFCATISRFFGSWRWNIEDSRQSLSGDHPGWQNDSSSMRWDFDMNREPGIRLSVDQSADSFEIWMMVHHSCSDARAAIRFLSDCFAYYEDGESRRPSASPADELAHRGMGSDRPLWHYLFPYGKRWHRLWTFYANPVKPLRLRKQPENEPPSTCKPTFFSRRIAFRRDDWRILKKELPTDATMNDVVLAITFAAIKHWNASNGADPKRDWIRVSMPMDVSTERTKLATNFTSMVFLDRRADRIKDESSLIAEIQKETNSIKKFDLGFVFTDVLRILNSIPGGMKLGLLKSFACTTVVSNLGVLNDLVLPTSKGGTRMKLEEFDFLVPVRRGTAAAIGIATAEETLHLCMNYDCRQLPPESANSFFDELGDRLAEFLDVNSSMRTNPWSG